MKLLFKSYAITGVLLLAGFASAVTTVSTNTSNGPWNDASRWSAGIPTQADDAVLAASADVVGTKISNVNAVARSLVLSNATQTSSVQILNGGSLTLYGSEQIAGKGAVSSVSASLTGSLTIMQTNAALAGSILDVASIDVFSLTVSANNGTARLTINSNQSFLAVNTMLGNGATGGGYLTLDGGRLVLSQRLTLGYDGNDSGTFVMNGGELVARFGIRAGYTSAPASAVFIFNDGRICSTNYAVTNYAFSASSPLNIQLAGTGVHEFNTAAEASVKMEATARLVDKAGENGTLLKTGPAELMIYGSNTYSGGTTVQEGDLSIYADGGLGSGNVQVGSASLYLTDGTRNDYIYDSAQLILQGSMSALSLGFAGTDTVSAVSLDGGASWLATGVYDAAALTVMGAGFYSGNGRLNVTSTPGPVAVPQNGAGIWDMTAMRTNPVSMTVVSSNVADGYVLEEVQFFVTNTAGTVDRFYCCIEKPDQITGPLPLVFMLHGGSGDASPSFAKVPLNHLPSGQKVISVAIDYGTSHTAEQQALHTLYGAPVPQSYSSASDVNKEILYRDMMGFRRILDYLLAQGAVDTNKVTVFGTSWGGFRSLLWAGVDERIAVATTSPGGGGMRGSSSLIGGQVAAISEPARERWYQQFDPLSHAAAVKAQVFVEAPANDQWFWLTGLQENLKAVANSASWVIVPNNNHGVGAPNADDGYAMPYLMNALFGTVAWPQILPDAFNSSGMMYEWQTQTNGIASAELWFSPGATETEWPSRYWLKIPATFSGGKWSASLPNDLFEVAGEAFVSVTDTNGFKASSYTLTRGGRDPQITRCSLWQDGAAWDVASQENGWRNIDSTSALIEKGTATGSVRITPAADGNLAVCNNSVILAAPYATSRQGLRLVLNGNGTSGPLSIELHKKSQVSGGSIYKADVTVGSGSAELILPWSAFVPQGSATGNPYPFDGLAITGTRAGNTPVTIESVDFYEPETATGVPHWWPIENGYSGDMETAALLDDDRDGAKAWQEYFAGTDPLSPVSVFKVSIAMKPEQKALLTWAPVSQGRKYTVESAGDLRNGFSVEVPQMTYPTAAYTSSVFGVQRFYKVAIDYTGTVRSAGSYLPPGVAAITISNTVRLARYNAVGTLVDLRAFGVNYYDAFSRYMEDVTNRSFVAGFDYLAAHKIPVARVHTRGYGMIGWDLYFSDKAEYYRRLDDFIQQAEQRDVGLLLDLIGGLNTGELVDDAVAAGYLTPGVDFNPPSPLNRDIYGMATYAEYRTDLAREDSGSSAFIAYYTKELISRYKDSPAVWGVGICQ